MGHLKKLKALLFDVGAVLYHRPRRGALLKPFLASMVLPKSLPDQATRVMLKRQAHVMTA